MKDTLPALWIRQFHIRPGATHRIVCFPHAGGSATFFHPLSAAMPGGIETLHVQYPGRQDRHHEPPVDDMSALAARVAAALAVHTDLPLTFFGHSMGATLAFEVTRRLECAGVAPTGLFVSGRAAPSRHRGGTTHLGSDAELVRAVRALGGTDSRVFADDEIVRMILPAIRNDFRAAETYRYEPGPDVSCPIHALIGDADPQVTAEEAEDWAKHTTAEFTMHIFAGGHFYLLNHQQTIVDILTEHARQVRAH